MTQAGFFNGSLEPACENNRKETGKRGILISRKMNPKTEKEQRIDQSKNITNHHYLRTGERCAKLSDMVRHTLARLRVNYE
jgi:hypothetical protein